MSKNILILSSSPRRGGNSDTLCDEFMRGAIESGNQVEKIFLRDKNIHPCTGCSVCSRYKKPCPQKDDVAEVIEKMLAADVIVMGTPVYFYAMSAQMKMMIDRCCGPYTEMKNKEFYFIATAADYGPYRCQFHGISRLPGEPDGKGNAVLRRRMACGRN